MSIRSRISVIQMRLRPSSYGHATAHGQRDDPVVEMSSKKIACGGSCKESHLGISARSWIPAKTLSSF